MLSLSQVQLLLFTFLVEPAALPVSCSEDAGSVQDTFTMADMIDNFLHSFKPVNNLMDVFVTPECVKEDMAMFKTFLDSRDQPVTLWTDGKAHMAHFNRDWGIRNREGYSHVLYFVCGKYDAKNIDYSLVARYLMTDFFVFENAIHPWKNPRAPRKLAFLPPRPRLSGMRVLSFANGSAFLTTEFGTDLVSDLKVAKNMWLERRRKLSGSSIEISCLSGYSCAHSGLNVTTVLLRHRNASVSVHRSPTVLIKGMYLSTFAQSIAHPIALATSLFDVVTEFESAGFSFYVRKRDRVPKETIFFLTYSREVWVGLLSTSVLLLLTFGLISKITLTANANISAFVFPMLGAFFQQSVHINSFLLRTYSSRLLYGVMALMIVVLSTAFKGCLTSLLNNVPLQGEAIRFQSLEDLVLRGFRLCILEYQGVISELTNSDDPWIVAISRNAGCCGFTVVIPCDTSSVIISPDGRDTFFTYNSRTGPSEALRRKLLGMGYVETEGTAFSHPVGTQTRSSSVYRHDIRDTLSGGFQAGLYARAAAIAEHKSRSVLEDTPESTDRLVLTLSDLRPFFLAWFLGVSLSIIVFIVEVILSCVQCPRRKRRV